MDPQDNTVMAAGHNADTHYTHQHAFPCTELQKKTFKKRKTAEPGHW